MKPILPALALRTTRVRLLAATYEDALLARSMEGGDGMKGSRLNLPDELWSQGSYRELDTILPQTSREFRARYMDKDFRRQPDGQTEWLTNAASMMPRDIFVPPDVSENAGYLLGEASAYQMPEAERHRRWACRPTVRVSSSRALDVRPKAGGAA